VIEFVGFNRDEVTLIRDFVGRFRADEHSMAELARVERFSLPGYLGRVVPQPSPCGLKLPTTVFLAACRPFTIAHELAHVSDIAVRRQETLDHMAERMPAPWHLSHRMSSEYYANRIASGYVGEDEVFKAFTGDLNGMRLAAVENDWASFLIYYALLLGIFHGLGRFDCDPVRPLDPAPYIPEAVREGMNAFRDNAVDFFAEFREAAE
jgi:hypothetical protein